MNMSIHSHCGSVSLPSFHPFLYVANLACSSALFLRCRSNSEKKMSLSNLPFIYKGYPLTQASTYTHTHAQVPTHTHTNEDLMTVSEIITRLACSTEGLKLTPCPQTHTHTHNHPHIHTSSGPSPQAHTTSPQ